MTQPTYRIGKRTAIDGKIWFTIEAGFDIGTKYEHWNVVRKSKTKKSLEFYLFHTEFICC